MDIRLTQIAKRYRYDWIFKNLDFHFQGGRSYAILGPNGSGKSTLMRILSGHLTPSRGRISFEQNVQLIPVDEAYIHISYAAPYIDVIEELTLKESIAFHQRFKPLLAGLDGSSLIDLLGMKQSANKQIRYFSSGMKQRLKLALSICSNTPILLLDEPTTNLDQQGYEWYHSLIERYTTNRLVVVASNVTTDYAFCAEQINITDWK